MKPKRENIDKAITRCLGKYSAGLDGPTVICICGIHGNEPSGILAFSKVLSQLRQMTPGFNGVLYGIAGNIKAIGQKVRFIDRDLNRIWGQKQGLIMSAGKVEHKVHEEQEMDDLKKNLEVILGKATGQVFILDLHTTSSKSTPFISINDTIRNRDFALKFHLPIVLGIEEFLEGTILNYMNESGYIALGFEGGQHDDPDSVRVHESAIWAALFHSGAIYYLPDWCWQHLNFLHDHSAYSGKVFDVRHRHAVKEEDRFKMFLGFENFQSITKDQVLATDRSGEIKAPQTGRIFMPLYQKLGNDGFFVVREIRYFWLLVSKTLRKYNFHMLLFLLPGIRPYNDLRHTIVVNKKVARWKVLDFFHLLGFRRKSDIGRKIVFEKREFDTKAPAISN